MQFFPTAVCNVTVWRHSRLRAHWLMALDGGGLRGEISILRSPGIAASPISLLSMGGVCGRSLQAEKILFTGRQTCSLYLVLWLCGEATSKGGWQPFFVLSGWLHFYFLDNVSISVSSMNCIYQIFCSLLQDLQGITVLNGPGGLLAGVWWGLWVGFW